MRIAAGLSDTNRLPRGGPHLAVSCATRSGRLRLIGFTANASVFATLICEPTAPFTEHSTDPAGVPLQPNGDFQIDDVLSPLPAAECVSPVLLIRVTGANPGWFAAGIPKQD